MTVSPTSYEFRTAHLSLRPARVAIQVPRADHWRSASALALYAAGQCWGGAGYVVCHGDDVGAALTRVLRQYDPDHLTGFVFSGGQWDSIRPGSLRASIDGSVPDELVDDLLASAERLEFTRYEASAALRARLSPYYFEHNETARPHIQTMSTAEQGVLPKWTVAEGAESPPFAIAPSGVGGDLGLALAIRCGFASEPHLPFEDDATDVPQETRSKLLRFAVGGDPSAMPEMMLWFGSGPAMSVVPEDAPPIWKRTERGVVSVGPGRTVNHHYVVVGDEPEDFALSLALHRMLGQASWIAPGSMLKDRADIEAVRRGFWDLQTNSSATYGRTVVTSASLSRTDIDGVMRAVRGEESFSLADLVDPYGNRWDPPVFVDAASLDLSEAYHLACSMHDFDIAASIPGAVANEGSFTFATAVPVRTPRDQAFTQALRPFWEVDVHVSPTMPPPTRTIPTAAWAAPDGDHFRPWVRSSGSGLSFHSHHMGIVLSGQSLEQSVAQPKLRIPGLLEWIGARMEWVAPGTRVEPSDAGRRAQVIARLFGSRREFLERFPELHPLFRSFLPASPSSSLSYPEGNGMCLSRRHGLLTFSGARAVLGQSALGDPEVRDRLDYLLERGVLRRGLVLLCPDCGTKAFYGVDSLGQRNDCVRCGGTVPFSQSAWRSPNDEPTWFYDLHGALRELLTQDGDVPLLGAARLQAQARSFVDVPEIDIIDSDGRTEIDLVMLADGRLIVGEAKKKATLGSGRTRSKAIDKLVRVASALLAEELLLVTTDVREWPATEVAQIERAIGASKMLPAPTVTSVSLTP